MPTFSSKPIGRKPQSAGGWTSTISSLAPRVRRHPVLLFGVPFILTIVGGSYGLSYLTQTRYDYNASKVQTVSKQDELGMRKDRRKVDIREEYFRLQSKDSELDDWEPKRISRPEGVPEWGVPPTDSSSNSIYNIQAQELPKGRQDPFSNADGSLNTKSKVILGPDGKPCRACNSKLAFSAAMRGTKGSQRGAEEASDGSGSGTVALSSSSNASTVGLGAAATSLTAAQSDRCPPDGEEIGRATWSFLHSTAAYYPSQPSKEQQTSITSLVQALPYLYPCHSCSAALKEELQREAKESKSWEDGVVLQQAAKSGPALRKWLCGLHNEVNVRLGKPTWKCEEKVLQEKWLTGPEDGSCD